MMLLLLLLLVTLFMLIFSMIWGSSKQEQAAGGSLAARLKQTKVSGDQLSLRDEERMKKSFVERVLLPTATRFSEKISSFLPSGMVARADQMILEAGLSDKVTGLQLMTLSYMFMAGLFLLFGFLGYANLMQGKFKFWQVTMGVGIATILGYRLPLGVVASRANKRKHEIQKALPFTFDLISISVEAGMAFDGAMATVADRTKGALSEEMKRALREVNLGISRQEALDNLGKRSGVEDLQSFLTAVNYISRLGGSLVDVIRIQTQAMRVKRRQRAEKLAAQAPVKMMIPLVLFILPCVFVIVLGPPGYQAMVKMQPMMQNIQKSSEAKKKAKAASDAKK